MAKSKNIVIIEEKNLIRKRIRDILIDYKYNVIADYASGENALSNCNFEELDLVIMGIKLEGSLNGFETAEKIVEEKNIPFIFLTGKEDNNFFYDDDFYSLSIYLSKPFTKSELINNIEMLFYKFELIKEITEVNEEQRLLLNNIQNQVWFLKSPEVYGRVNKAHAEFAGYKKKEMENKKIKELFSEKSAEKLISFNKKVFAKKEEIIDEFWIKNKNGNKRLLSIIATPSLDEDGEIKYLICSAEDITKKKKMEKTLIEREQRFLSIIATLPDILVLFNKKGVYKSIWTGHEENLYTDRQKMVGKKFEDVLPNKVAKKIREHLDKTLKYNELQVLEYKLRVKSGEVKYFESRMTAISQDQAVVIVRDITDRKKAEEELEVQKAYFEQLFERSPDAIALLNINSKIRDINESFTKLFGYEKNEIIGKQINELIIPDKSKEKAYNMSSRIRKGEIVQEELQRIDKKGNKIDVYHLAYPIELENEKVGIYALYRDIRDRKKLEKNLRESKNKIEKLHEIALEMESIDNEDEIYKLTVRAAENILNFDVCSLDIVEDNMFVVKARSSGVKDDGIDEKAPVNTGVAGKVYKMGESVLTNNIDDEPDAAPAKSTYRSAMTVPIDKYGIFQVISTKENDFDEVDLELTELLIAHTSAAIKRIRAEKRIKYLGYHDSLTDLYNRTYFEEEMSRLDVSRNLPFSIIVGDLNNLKKVNDKYGHDCGDEVIKHAAEILQNSCREEDILARWGGDEFGLLLPSTDKSTAQKIASRIQREMTNYSYKDINVDLALGVATKTKNSEDINEIFKEADDNMYENKAVIKGHVS
ncbi:MAG: PAS domain S-box protein [Bacillota bacterium]